MQSFSHHLIRPSEIFFRSKLSVAFVNLKPILPGHVLVIPKRVVKRFTELLPEEVSDLFISAQTVGKAIEKEYGGTSLTVAIQDGPEAGQSVHHVHVHILPRRRGDFKNVDDIYDELHSWNKLDDDGRMPRSLDEMAEEAARLCRLFPEQSEAIDS